jgi:hypothetical protein
MKRILLSLGLCVALYACGSNSTAPTTPSTTQQTATKIVTLSGNLAFGNVEVGKQTAATLDIRNTGTASVTVSGMSISSGLTAVYTSSWTSGTIAAGATQSATIFFNPAEAKAYTGTLSVNGDQSSGTNAISISGTGTVPTATYTLSGFVNDGTTGLSGRIANATVRVTDGANAGKSSVTDSSGAYSISGLTAGTFTISISITNFQTSTNSITLSSNTALDFSLARGSSSPAPSPSGPSPTPGPNGDTCPASQAPSGSTAACKDGSFSQSQNRPGTCSSHGGVLCWICPGALCNGLIGSQSGSSTSR